MWKLRVSLDVTLNSHNQFARKCLAAKGENFESHLNSFRVKLFWNIFFVLDVRRQTGHEPNGRQNPQTSANVRTGLRQERYLKSLIPSNLLQL